MFYVTLGFKLLIHSDICLSEFTNSQQLVNSSFNCAWRCLGTLYRKKLLTYPVQLWHEIKYKSITFTTQLQMPMWSSYLLQNFDEFVNNSFGHRETIIYTDADVLLRDIISNIIMKVCFVGSNCEIGKRGKTKQMLYGDCGKVAF